MASKYRTINTVVHGQQGQPGQHGNLLRQWLEMGTTMEISVLTF